jgi:hypothetical protein
MDQANYVIRESQRAKYVSLRLSSATGLLEVVVPVV